MAESTLGNSRRAFLMGMGGWTAATLGVPGFAGIPAAAEELGPDTAWKRRGRALKIRLDAAFRAFPSRPPAPIT